MNRTTNPIARLLAPVAVAGALTVVSAPAAAQSHGVSITTSCNEAIAGGQTLECAITIAHDDEAGDTQEILEAWQMVHVYDGGNPVGDGDRVPATGSLPMLELLGNARFAGTPGELPVILGAAGSTLNGLTGAPEAGAIILSSDSYILEAGQADTVLGETHLVVADHCDGGDPIGCNAQPDEQTDLWIVPILRPAIRVLLSYDADAIEACGDDGSEVTFYYAVFTPGLANVTLGDVTLTTDACGSGSPGDGPLLVSGDDADPGVLNLDEIWIFECTAPVGGDFTRSATATGIDTMLGIPVDDTDSVFIPSGHAERLLAFDADENDRYGSAVAISGDAMIVGAPYANGGGSAYVYRSDGPTWAGDVQQLHAESGASHRFGTSVAIDGDVAIVGDHLAGLSGSAAGAAHVFRFQAGAWGHDLELHASDGQVGDSFGAAVAIEGDVAVVGAPLDDDNGGASGAAYLFRYDGTTWQQEQKLVPPDGDQGEYFGTAVSISGNALVIGTRPSGCTVGPPGQPCPEAGSAYVFRFDGSTWQLEQKLVPPDGEDGDRFGISVSIDGDALVVGADQNGEAATYAGAVYIFRFDGAAWGFEQKLLPAGLWCCQAFGTSVCVDGDAIIVGAPEPIGYFSSNAGNVYLYRFDGEAWTNEATHEVWDASEGDQLGFSVGLSGSIAVAGAPRRDQDGDDAGAVYIFNECDATCPGDVDGNGAVDVDDIVAVVLDFGSDGALHGGDADGNGVVDIDDLVEVILHFGACE